MKRNGTTEQHICSICGAEYRNYGNNAQPVNDGRCCDNCHWIVVIPARMKAFGQIIAPRREQ